MNIFTRTSISIACLSQLISTAHAAPVNLVLEYQDASGATSATATASLTFRDEAFLLAGRDRHEYWNAYYLDYHAQSGLAFDQWYNLDNGIDAATITVNTGGLINAGDGTFTYLPLDLSLKNFFWAFSNSESADLSRDLLDQLDHFLWMPASSQAVTGSPSMLNEEPHSNDRGDFDYHGDFTINTNNFGCGNSTVCYNYEDWGNTYPNGRPRTLVLDLVSVSVVPTPVPLPAAGWLFVTGLLVVVSRLRIPRKKFK